MDTIFLKKSQNRQCLFTSNVVAVPNGTINSFIRFDCFDSCLSVCLSVQQYMQIFIMHTCMLLWKAHTHTHKQYTRIKREGGGMYEWTLPLAFEFESLFFFILLIILSFFSIKFFFVRVGHNVCTKWTMYGQHKITLRLGSIWCYCRFW